MGARDQEANAAPEILRILRSINDKMDRLVDAISELSRRELKTKPSEVASNDLPLDVDTMLSLPDHLRRTILAVGSIGDATADDVAGETGRTRAAESDYLNQLTKMGLLRKHRKGRMVYFSYI